MDKTIMTRAYWSMITCIFGVVLASDGVLAGGFALREQSATYQGMSFAGAAASGGGISSMFWNPATVTEAVGLQTEGNHTLIFPSTEITPTDGTFAPLLPLGASGDIAIDAYVPAFYAAYQINDNFYLGLSVNGPFGLATKPNYAWAGQTYARTSEVFSANITPTIGYRFNDYIAFGAGLQIEYFDVTLKQGVPVGGLPAATDPSAILTGDDTNVGFTFGLTLTPMEGTEIGLGFRSSVEHELEGKLTFPGFPSTVPIKAKLKTPEMISLGVRQRVNEAFTVLGTVEWTNWSRLGTIPVTNKTTGAAVTIPGAGELALPFEYDDGWFFALGGEYDWNNWTFRAGVGYELSPIDNNNRSLRLPDDDRLWLSIGTTYKPSENLAFNLGYSYLTTFDTEVNVGSSNVHYTAPLTFAGNVDADVHIISAGFQVKWGGLINRMRNKEPIVRKY